MKHFYTQNENINFKKEKKQQKNASNYINLCLN